MTATPDPDRQRRRARWQLAGVTLGLAVLSVLLWKFTALAKLAEPQNLAAVIADLRNSPWSAPALVLIIIVASLALFPLTVLFVVSAMILDSPLAIGTSLAGALSSAWVGYVIGARYFRQTATTAAGQQVARLQELLRNRGTLAIAMARFVPVAPYLAFNIAAGAVGVRLSDFLAGTALAVTPVIVVLTLFEVQVRQLFTQPTLLGFATLLTLIVFWVAVILILRRAIERKDPR